MALYIIGCVIELIACLVGLFGRVVFSQDWEYGNISEIGSVRIDGSKSFYSLINLYGIAAILLFAFVIIVTIIYGICYLTGNKRLIPPFVIELVFVGPLAIMFFAIGSIRNPGNFIGNDLAVHGTGVNSGLTGTGYLMILLTIAAIFVMLLAIFQNKESSGSNKKPKLKERVNKNTTQNMDPDDFGF